jgi:asparagine synthase (glutamine-hydrolysing)
MSGICGYLRWDGQDVATEHLDAMNEAVAYRGPDGSGVWARGAAGLGHLALQITPESRGERQPLHDPEQGLVLVADARIDNRDELIRELALPVGKGAHGPSDASLILLAYRRWGADCAARLIGDFAFAIWDGRDRRLFAARDPLGLRSLYFREEADRFLFGTEITQILALPDVPAEIFRPAVAAYLSGSFGPPEWTAYAGISRLPPGEAILVTATGSRRWRFWQVDADRRIRYRSDEEYVDHFRDLLLGSVKARLRSTKPVGLLLSGGVDSTSIAAAAGWLLAKEPGVSVPEFRAYSFAWDELTECDERHVSGPIAEYFGFPVTGIPADDAWPLRNYPEPCSNQGDPFLFGHYVLLQRACAAARQEGMGMMFGGDRGDLVAGMAIYDLPSLLRRGRWSTLLGEVRTLARWSGRSVRRQFRREVLRVVRDSPALRGRPWSWIPRIQRLTRPSTPRPPAWLSPELREEAERQEGGEVPDYLPPFRQHAVRERFRNVFTPLHLHGVGESERMHARFHQGFGDPWSDRRLVEFVLAIPQRVLNTVGGEKRLSRLAMKGILPDSLVDATRKIVPTALFDRGLRIRERDSVLDLISDSESARRGFVDSDRLREAYLRITQNPQEDSTFLWKFVTLEMWLRDHWREDGGIS